MNKYQFVDMFPFTDKRLKSVDMFLAAVFTNRQQSVNMFACTNEGYELVVLFPRAIVR